MCFKSSLLCSGNSGELRLNAYVISEMISFSSFCNPNIYSLGLCVQNKFSDHAVCMAQNQPPVERTFPHGCVSCCIIWP